MDVSRSDLRARSRWCFAPYRQGLRYRDPALPKVLDGQAAVSSCATRCDVGQVLEEQNEEHGGPEDQSEVGQHAPNKVFRRPNLLKQTP